MLYKDILWTENNLFLFLNAPKKFIPGTKMIFPGIQSAQDKKGRHNNYTFHNYERFLISINVTIRIHMNVFLLQLKLMPECPQKSFITRDSLLGCCLLRMALFLTTSIVAGACHWDHKVCVPWKQVLLPVSNIFVGLGAVG